MNVVLSATLHSPLVRFWWTFQWEGYNAVAGRLYTCWPFHKHRSYTTFRPHPLLNSEPVELKLRPCSAWQSSGGGAGKVRMHYSAVHQSVAGCQPLGTGPHHSALVHPCTGAFVLCTHLVLEYCAKVKCTAPWFKRPTKEIRTKTKKGLPNRTLQTFSLLQ